jgi:4-alpha-glucanotransferase
MGNKKQNIERASGILLHPTSLPGPFGMGDLGSEAFAFVDALVQMKQKLWQVLPLYPTGFGDSPYAALSVFAGNPYLISPELLFKEGLLKRSMISDPPRFSASKVDFPATKKYRTAVLHKAYSEAMKGSGFNKGSDFEGFCKSNKAWLEDFCLFMALKDAQKGKPWNSWPESYRMREPRSIEKARNELKEQIRYHKFLQFQFFKQWGSLKKYANEKNIRIIGDNPIYEAYDSADVWSHPELFMMDEDRRPIEVSGVPPDCFSKTGQLWGNPLYNWTYHKASGYAWWKSNLQASFMMTDYVRIDHFIGFVRYYAIPFGAKTAKIGRWRKGPGLSFFKALQTHFGSLPLLAEDLGAVTDEVIRIRNRMGFPGMKILQEAFDGNPQHHFLPHTYTKDFMVYTGTHDTNTTLASLRHMPRRNVQFLKRYLGIRTTGEEELVWALIGAALSSVACMAIIPMQDLLCLGEEARMNLPGTIGGNWAWRYQKKMLNKKRIERLGMLTESSGRA